jgi:integrase
LLILLATAAWKKASAILTVADLDGDGEAAEEARDEEEVVAGVEGDGDTNASDHTLRHTFATHAIKRGTKLEVVRQALGHESLVTTSIYVHLAREMMDKELQEHAL